jgi:hypothetical protein
MFFLAALSADLYEHFLHASGNNVFMVAPGDWTAWFNVSVFILLTLEILGCSIGVLSLRDGTRKGSTPESNSNLRKQDYDNRSSSQFNVLGFKLGCSHLFQNIIWR